MARLAKPFSAKFYPFNRLQAAYRSAENSENKRATKTSTKPSGLKYTGAGKLYRSYKLFRAATLSSRYRQWRQLSRQWAAARRCGAGGSKAVELGVASNGMALKISAASP